MDALRLKLIARQGLKIPVLLRSFFKRDGEAGFYYLIYHRVSGDSRFDVDLPLSLFRRQLEFLARARRVVSYDEALNTLKSGQEVTNEVFVLTFDDGYEDFYTHVFPLLRDLELPAILFVTTGFVETGIPYPILHHASPDATPVDWDMLGEMAASGLVTVGAHTHTHPILTNESETRVEEELAKPLEIFRARLGIKVQHFAYPKALWNQKVETLVTQHYASAVICDERKAIPNHFNPYRIPRIPIRHSDGWLFFLAKTRGWLEGEEALYDKLHGLMRNHRRATN
jgi:peptidoglycan/xylan/chitin deacetylase (PgdA/CDA1 family)